MYICGVKKEKIVQKTFTFTALSPDQKEKYTLKESELKQKHIDLLLGELLNRWDNSPKIVQIKFMQMLSEAAMGKMNERFENVIEATDKLNNRINPKHLKSERAYVSDVKNYVTRVDAIDLIKLRGKIKMDDSLFDIT